MKLSHSETSVARNWRWWLSSIPVAVSAALATNPGFGVLDYHNAAVMAPCVGLVAAVLAAHGVRRATRPLVWCVLGPLAMAAIAGLWHPWCAPWTGAGFYLLGPVCSASVGICVGTISHALRPGRWAGGLACALAALSTAPEVTHFLREPQAFAYHGLFGWIAGPLYEDEIALRASYVWFRLLDGAWWLALTAAALSWRDGGRDASHPRPRRVTLWAMGTAAAALMTQWGSQSDLGWRVHEATIRSELSATCDIPLSRGSKLTLHLVPSAGWRVRSQETAEEAWHAWQELTEFFGGAPQAHVRLFLYPNAERKRRLMGAYRVELAKPWLHQAHLVTPRWGQSVLRHELAHVFAAMWNDNLFRVPMRHGVLPDPLLIEGVAVAAEWPLRGDLDPHHWSAAMRRLKLAPKMEALMTPQGFFHHHAANTYTLAGSFLRWLRDTRGVRPVACLYASGDFERCTGDPLTTLTRRWETYIDQLPLSERHLAHARARFERSGLFARPCALEVGRCRARARLAWRRGDAAEALQAWSTLVPMLRELAGDTPLGFGVQRRYSLALLHAAKTHEALRQLPDEAPLTELQRSSVRDLRGDILWAQGKPNQARAAWAQSQTARASSAWRRRQQAKIWLSERQLGREVLDRYWLSFGPMPGYARALRRWEMRAPDDWLPRYLGGMNLGTSTEAGAVMCSLATDASVPGEFRDRAARRCATTTARHGRCGALRQTLASQLSTGQWRPSEVERLQRRCRARRSMPEFRMSAVMM